MKKLLLLLTTIYCAYTSTLAQDIHFSQFYENAILRNPALTGIFSGDYKAGLSYRTQWGNISNPFQTIMVSAESRKLVNEETGDYLSFGVAASYDHAGAIDFNSLQVMPALSYNKSLEDKHQSYLSVGFAGGYIQRSIDYSKMTVDNQWIAGGYDPSAPSKETMTTAKISHWDVSAGISLNSSIGEDNKINYYLGAAAWHVSKPRETFNASETFIRLTTKYIGSFGIHYKINDNFSATVHANYVNQQPYQETIVGGFLSWRNSVTLSQPQSLTISAGCFVRLKDAFIPTLKLDYNTYAFTMSYDMTTSSLKPVSSGQGGWELSVYIRGKISRPEAKDQVKCPRFEDIGMPGDLR